MDWLAFLMALTFAQNLAGQGGKCQNRNTSDSIMGSPVVVCRRSPWQATDDRLPSSLSLPQI